MSGSRPTDGSVDTTGESDLWVHRLGDDETAQPLGSLSCDTTRDLLSCLRESPAAATELATRVETFVQNTRHHLGNFIGADLVHVADTRYPEKSREMRVYAAALFVICIGGDGDDRETFAEVVSAFLE